jgi:sugar-specific transcriptional regulator TrmB
MDEEAIIQEAGLTGAESKVYISLLKLGGSTVGPIIRESGLQSSVVYNCLQRLMGDGLAYYTMKGSRKLFSVADPHALMNIMKERETRLSSVMDKLVSMRETAKNRQDVYIFEGQQAARTVFNDILHSLKTGQEQLVMGVAQSGSGLGEFMRKWDLRRVKAGIRKRVIASPDEKEWLDYYKRQPLTRVKAVKEFGGIKLAFNVYGAKVAMVLWGRYPIYIVIDRPEIAENFRKYFEFVWAHP